MAKWDYLRRAYAIKEYAYLRQTEVENDDHRSKEEANTLEAVTEDIRYILEMNESVFSSAREDPYEYKTIRQCKRWLKDFG